ncbi:MAG: sul [Gammaproteobacteria bacterium]|jgi:carbonic anhydrase|nr:sul [Gammaproteobacteria bacterium]
MFNWNTVKDDLIASIVVLLVAIPLCLGIALASGAPLFSGLVTGIIGGIIVGALSGSSVSVSGPAAGMIAVVLAAIAALGSFHSFLLALFLAGFIQIAIGLFRAGFIAVYIPLNVINGLLAAIGILIIIKQLPLAFGYISQPELLANALEVAQETFSLTPLFFLVHHLHIGATLITVVSLAILIYWPKLPLKATKVIPGAVVTVIVAVIINQLLSACYPALALQDSHLVNIPVNESFSSIIAQFEHPKFADLGNYNVYIYAFMIAIVASLETLLNLEAAEKMAKTRKYVSRNRELIAQGVGNLFSGLLGGLPITSVIVRSTVNIQAGAKSKLATIFHGILLFLALALVPNWLNLIPIAALAAILIHTGYKLARVGIFKDMYVKGFDCFFPFVVTVVAIVFSNLLTGVLIGLGTSFFFILRQNSKNRFLTVNELHPSGEVIRLILPQQATFLNKAAIVEALKDIKSNQKVVIDAKGTDYIDYDILEIIKEFKEYQAKEKNVTLNLEGFKRHYALPNQENFVTATTYDVQSSLTPEKILKILQEGNQRFINNTPIHKNYQQHIEATKKSQHPIAVMLSCIDSRVPVELIFDLSVGDAFVARVAGTVLNEDIIASIEYACHVAGAKLIIIMGHESCGAIKAACEDVSFGHVPHLVKKIKPAIEACEASHPNHSHSADDPSFLSSVISCNVDLVKKRLYERSEILRHLIDTGAVGLIGAVYDVSTGEINFKAG